MTTAILHLIEKDRHSLYRFDDDGFQVEFEEPDPVVLGYLGMRAQRGEVGMTLSGRADALLTTADTLDGAIAGQMSHLNSRVRELEEAQKGLTSARKARRVSDLFSAVIEAEGVEHEVIDNGPDAWPTTDSIECRRLSDYDPMARDIRERLGVDDDAPVYVTITAVTEGYSEYTQEQSTLLGIECGDYAINVADSGSWGIDMLVRWIDGEDTLHVERREGKEA